MKKTTKEEIDRANFVAVGYLRENCQTEARFTFGYAIGDGARVTMLDDEGQAFMEVGAEAVTPAALVAINLIYARGLEHGGRFGRWAAQSEIRKALGIETAFQRLESDQRAADEGGQG